MVPAPFSVMVAPVSIESASGVCGVTVACAVPMLTTKAVNTARAHFIRVYPFVFVLATY